MNKLKTQMLNGKTLYLKYRSQTLDELDLESVRESLKKIVESGRIPHAFLFSGPKGTGKTSAARILAKIVNCQARPDPALQDERRKKKFIEPCNKCEQCVSITKGTNIDVIELDAASHRGIDDVRSLRDAVKLAPARARKKVYIIDEAHMLTTEASNALLKTLEEPPSHVVFILATTNPEKLIETIRSRTVNVVFRKATEDEIARSLQRVVKGEKIKIDKESLNLIAQKSDGSFRDAIKILEQLVSEKKVLEAKDIEEFLFKRQTFNLEEFLTHLSERKTKDALGEVEEVIQKGGSMENLLEALLTKLRGGLLAKVGVGTERLEKFSKEDLVDLIELFSEANLSLKGAFFEQLPVEIAIVKWCENKLKVKSEKLKVSADQNETEIQEQKARRQFDSGARGQVSAPVIKIEGKEITDEVWRTILAHVKPINTSIEALLRAAKPIGYDGKVLTLGVFYKFHKERLEENSHKRVLEDVVAAVLGNPVRVVCTLTEPPARKEVEVKEKEAVLTEGGDKDIIKIAEEIFGN